MFECGWNNYFSRLWMCKKLMVVHIYSLKVKSQANIWVKHMTNHKKSARDLTNLNIFWEIQRKTSCLRYKSQVYWRYVSRRMHPKSCPIFPLKNAATLLSRSRKGTVVSGGTGVKILEVVDWLQVAIQPSQLESVAATRISCS